MRSIRNNIYILSIGINKYKNNRIKNLKGCTKDVQRLANCIKQRFNIPEKNYKILLNEEASKQGIVDTFRNHFGVLRDGDVALFHFSGHGSWEYAPQAFVEAKIEPAGGRNESLVCYDSREEGIYDLADKELRMLIAEIQYPVGTAPRKIHFVSLFDCCHAGSMLRNEEEGFNLRWAPAYQKKRTLNSYLDGKYQKKYEDDGVLTLPNVNYISLTACSPRELALEDSQGGIFTTALIELLSSAWERGYFPSYSELFSSLHKIVKLETQYKQTPHFEYTGEVNPHHCFLMEGESNAFNYSELSKREDSWRVNIGAIHGIDFENIKKFKAPIFEKTNLESPVGFIQIEAVELEYTRTIPHFISAYKEKNDQTYFVALTGRKLPIKIYIAADAYKAHERIQKELAKPKNKNQFLVTQLANYELNIEKDKYCIYQLDRHEKKMISGISKTDASSTQYIINQLNKIAKWEQINNLQTPKNAGMELEEICFDFYYKGMNEARKKVGNNTENQIKIEFNPDFGPIPYWIEVKNNSASDLWFYLVHLDRRFGISQKNESYLKKVIAKGDWVKLYDSGSKGVGLGISDHSKEVQDTYLLIASKKALNIPYVFEQTSFGNDYGKLVENINENKIYREDQPLSSNEEVNWIVKRIEVIVRRIN